MIKRRGYLWNYYGFTKLHFWGVHIVGGLFALVGSILLVEAAFQAFDGVSNRQVYLLLAFSGISFLTCIAITAASMFSLLFFYGANKLEANKLELLESADCRKQTALKNNPYKKSEQGGDGDAEEAV
jgi:hypothetical protein